MVGQGEVAVGRRGPDQRRDGLAGRAAPLVGRVAVDGHGAGGRGEQPGDEAQQGGLARPVRAAHDDARPRLGDQVGGGKQGRHVEHLGRPRRPRPGIPGRVLRSSCAPPRRPAPVVVTLARRAGPARPAPPCATPSTAGCAACPVSGIATTVRTVSTALYRRYRPETFADVIGQEHVTEPLMQALRTGRVNHAYLFSGPRGCGKTTSARILARCLNCEQGPTPEPCGTCDSCVALARGGSGTVDVIEIDAASHGGVDDARDLRERASYGPAQSRYKIYIIDEAHMVTPQGFNALLKIVEEPPEHVKFVFATTEPEKVIGTIRSRTHHYPFRLVPPGPAAGLHGGALRQGGRRGRARACCRSSCAPVAARCVTRCRCSTSSSPGPAPRGLTYESAAALLGFTDGELLDAVDRRLRGRRRRRGVPRDRQGHRDRPRPAALRRGPPRAAARPHRRRGRARRRRPGAAARARGPARADARCRRPRSAPARSRGRPTSSTPGSPR